jgi:AP-1 complex subunit beta-1
LVASAPEVQYVALRNIDLLLQAKPDILSKELRVFFCKYNDAPYVKLQKLEIMVRIANEKNYEQLLAELKEYALEVDMDFVRRAVKAIGQVAIKIEIASAKCVQALEDLISTKVNYVVQEATVVIKDILRKYPGYEGVIPTLCKYIDELDEPEARGSLIWIVGEYAEKISNADEILESFVEGFMEEFTQVCRHEDALPDASANTTTDATTNIDCRRQTVLEKAKQHARPCAEGAAGCDGRERQPGYP